MSGVVVDPIGVKARVKFIDYRSNCSRNIRLPHFVTNDDADNDNAGIRLSSHEGKTTVFRGFEADQRLLAM